MKNISSIEIPEQYDVSTGDMLMRIASDVAENQNTSTDKSHPFEISDNELPSLLSSDQDILLLKDDFLNKVISAIIEPLVDQEKKASIGTKLWHLMCMAIVMDKKSIHSKDVVLICLDSSVGITQKSIQMTYEVVCEIYAKFHIICETKIEHLFFQKSQKNPSIISGKQLNNNNQPIHRSSLMNYGIGSYDHNGEWQFGNQSLPSIPNFYAQTGANIVHPLYGMKFKFLKSSTEDSYILYNQNSLQGIIIQKNGLISKKEKARLSLFYYTDIITQMTNSLNKWIVYEDNNRKRKSIYISFGDKKKKFIFIKCFAMKTSYGSPLVWYTEFIDPRGRKFAEYEFVDDESAEDHAHDKFLSQKLAEYIASEMVAYAVSCIRKQRVPHPASVPPNGSAWASVRTNGSCSSIPPFMSGQAALNGSVLRPVFKSDSEGPPREGLVQVAVAQNSLTPSLLHLYNWNTFSKDCVSIFIGHNSCNVFYSPDQYYIKITHYNIHNILHATLCNASGDFIDEAAFTCASDIDIREAGTVILASALRVAGRPKPHDLGLILCVKPVLIDSNMQIGTDSIVGNVAGNYYATETLRNSWESSSVNSSSIIINKYSNQNAIYGNLTEKIAWFDKKTVENTQESKTAISDIDELAEKCRMYFTSEYVSDSIHNKETIKELLHSEKISSAIQVIAQEKHSKNYVPRLSRINNIGMKSNDKNRDAFLYCNIMLQPHGLSYSVILKGEHWPQVENSFTKEYIQIDPGSKKDDFLRLFEFEIICVDHAGNPMVKYCPNYQLGQISVPRCANIEEIICGYLPDFICWMSSEGVNLHKIATNSVRTASLKLTDLTIQKIPFDSSLINSHASSIKNWLLSYFPSLHDMNQNPVHDAVSVLEHLLNSTTLVDLPRDDGYCPARELRNGADMAALRAALLLHDIGKAAPQDGGVGGYSNDHVKKSVELAVPLLETLSLLDEQKKTAVFLIKNQDLIAQAQKGIFGPTDRTISHIGKICGTVLYAELLYHMHRCDNDSVHIFQQQSTDESTKIYGNTNLTSRQLIDRVISYIQNSTFQAVSKDVGVPSVLSSKKLSFRETRQANSVKISNGEKVIKTIHLGNINKMYQKEYQALSYNPEYWKMVQEIYDEMAESPDLSFAKALGMSYDGCTGTVVRGFYWTSPQYMDYMSENGLCAYDKADKFSINAMINAPDIREISIFKKFPQDILLVFDYHVGKYVTEDDVEYLGDKWRKWNSVKYGAQVFSLNYNGNADISNPQIAMDFGYSSILTKKSDPNDAAVMAIACLDPSRIALIGAYQYEKTTDPYQKGSASITPLHLTMRLSGGGKEEVLSPEIDRSEVFLDTSHKLHVCQPQRILLARTLWNGEPASVYTGSKDGEQHD